MLMTRMMTMDFMEDKFGLKNQAMKAGDYFTEPVMESLDGGGYFAKSPPKCAQAFGLTEHRGSPRGDPHGVSAVVCRRLRRGQSRGGGRRLRGGGGPGRQQGDEQQEAAAQDHLLHGAAGRAGEGLPEDALPGRLRAGAAGHQDGADRGQGAGVVPEPKSQVEEERTLRTNPTSQKSLCIQLRSRRVASQRQLHTDPKQLVVQSACRRLRGLALHAPPRLAPLRGLLLAPLGLGRRRPRLLPEPAEPVGPRLPQQLLRRRPPSHADPQRPPPPPPPPPPRLRDQARVGEALVQHRRAAHEGQGARRQHLLGHVIPASRTLG
ncbi:ALX homeobox protein 1 isoform X1 [Nerophis lumbriciformis]|uniref:ALX homeobox protein 1 isoform X1 n=1 Tax=Nerophis lumbriciformis TaxID=546530 RepID=UPI002ADF0A79|nr:solute carrier family 38 member 10-like isoform X1 [Nerophis lumbriciformis]